MAAVTICSDFGAPKNKVSLYFHSFPTYLLGSTSKQYEKAVNYMPGFISELSILFCWFVRLGSCDSFDLSNKWCWEPECHMHKDVIGGLHCVTRKNQLKWMEDLNIRPETVRLLEEKAGEKLLYIHLGNDITHVSPKAQVTKANRQAWTHQTKTLPPSKGSNLQSGRTDDGRGERLQAVYAVRGSHPNYTKSSRNSAEKTQITPDGPTDTCPKKHRWPAGVWEGAQHSRGNGGIVYCVQSL